MKPKMKFQFTETNGITLHTAVAGPEDGPLVILLHGFPEFWYGWRNQIEPLAHAGFRVIAPDQRGYNLSDKPSGIENYTIDKLRDDIIGLIHASGREKASIIGHDWGGAVAWYLTATKPELVERLIAINIPHPEAMKKIMLRYPPQWLKSSYMAFFQLPQLPEAVLAGNNYSPMKQALLKTSKREVFSDSDLKKYEEAWSQEGSITAMLNWYRAIRYGGLSAFDGEKIDVPVKIIWGMGDQFLSMKSAKASLEYCENGELIFAGEATHWVNHEQPLLINKQIIEFLSKD
ncbi:alpha/beta fold hydrolase [Evansella clarkii]|uniref:alpha/beta fold hydrolase n=1 Tax=Evansella clarkii TaxID=79879 RepID=UPI001FD36C02|nr:alpha/beta hydrolase [Evansella clarkii]